jgi:DNA modification methylase
MKRTVEQGRLMVGEDRQSRKRSAPSKKANDLDGRKWLRNSISIWSDIHKTPEEISLKHPAMFPVQLVNRLIESFTRSDQTVVLDPFSGIGSTVLAAEMAGKQGIGLDISSEYIAKAQQRPLPNSDLFEENGTTGAGERHFYEADARDLLQYVDADSVDFVVTSPPYWDILLQHRTADYKEIRNYGDSDSDLGRIADYRQFIDALGSVFANVLIALKPGCYCCVVVMDLRKGSKFFPLHSDLAVKMQEIGFLFDDLIIWDRKHEYNNLRPLGHPSVFRINKVHEYILIFQKPRTNAT